jgi:hypothetical protein
MIHVLINQANTFGVTLFDTPPITDEWIGISNGHWFPQTDLKIFGGWFGGANLTKITFTSPKLRAIVPPVIYPIQGSLLPPDRPHVWDSRTNPVPMGRIEEFQVLMNIGGGANAINTAVLIVGDQLELIPPGPMWTLHGTSTTAAVANQWTTVTVTWDVSIPAGKYLVYGTQHQSTNAIAHRWNFRQMPQRPGFLSITSLTNISDPGWNVGAWGAVGTFDTQAYPFAEVFCNAADAAHDFVMRMVKVA